MSSKSWRHNAFQELPPWAQKDIKRLREEAADYRTENARLRELLDYERSNR